MSVPSVKCFLGDQRRPLRGKIKRLFEEDTSTTTLLHLHHHPPPPPRLHGFHCSDCLICKDVSCRCDGDPVFWSFSSCGRRGLNMKVISGCFIQDAGLRSASLGFCRLFPLIVKFTHCGASAAMPSSAKLCSQKKKPKKTWPAVTGCCNVTLNLFLFVVSLIGFSNKLYRWPDKGGDGIDSELWPSCPVHDSRSLCLKLD